MISEFPAFLRFLLFFFFPGIVSGVLLFSPKARQPPPPEERDMLDEVAVSFFLRGVWGFFFYAVPLGHVSFPRLEHKVLMTGEAYFPRDGEPCFFRSASWGPHRSSPLPQPRWEFPHADEGFLGRGSLFSFKKKAAFSPVGAKRRLFFSCGTAGSAKSPGPSILFRSFPSLLLHDIRAWLTFFPPSFFLLPACVRVWAHPPFFNSTMGTRLFMRLSPLFFFSFPFSAVGASYKYTFFPPAN